MDFVLLQKPAQRGALIMLVHTTNPLLSHVIFSVFSSCLVSRVVWLKKISTDLTINFWCESKGREISTYVHVDIK
jgi:hypothetical protein